MSSRILHPNVHMDEMLFFFFCRDRGQHSSLPPLNDDDKSKKDQSPCNGVCGWERRQT